MKLPIFIVAGGTGGHVFPAIALAELLLAKEREICILTDTRTRSYWPSEWQNITTLPIQPFRKSIKGLFLFLWSLSHSLWLSVRLFWAYKNSPIVAFGGYPTLPVLIGAILLRRPIILHEQNAVIGRVNRLFSRFAQYLVLSWPDTHTVPSHKGLKIRLIGLPIRKAIADLHQKKYEKRTCANPLRILILGGSQGAQIFDTLVPEALGALPESYQDQLIITHQCRGEVLNQVKEAYKQTRIKVNLETFFTDIPSILSKIDFVICRSGASTLGEVTTAGIPALLVPYLHAKDDHQTANAQNLFKREAGWIITQQEFTKSGFMNLVISALEKPSVLFAASEASNQLKSHKASQKLADIVLEFNSRREVS